MLYSEITVLEAKILTITDKVKIAELNGKIQEKYTELGKISKGELVGDEIPEKLCISPNYSITNLATPPNADTSNHPDAPNPYDFSTPRQSKEISGNNFTTPPFQPPSPNS